MLMEIEVVYIRSKTGSLGIAPIVSLLFSLAQLESPVKSGSSNQPFSIAHLPRHVKYIIPNISSEWTRGVY